MTDFATPTDLLNNRGLIANPEAFAREKAAASWLYLCAEQFASRAGAPLARPAAFPRARGVSRGRPGRGARGDREAWLDPVRSDRGRRPESRSDAARAGRRLRAGLVRHALRAP